MHVCECVLLPNGSHCYVLISFFLLVFVLKVHNSVPRDTGAQIYLNEDIRLFDIFSFKGDFQD